MRIFAKGEKLSAKPLHDGICAYCSELLHGTAGNSVSNEAFGPPVDVDGLLLANKPGAKARDQQPPFLLRFSPALLAYEIPAVFKHEPESNKLSLQDGVSPPWLRRTTGRNSRWAKADATNTWLYSPGCIAGVAPRPALEKRRRRKASSRSGIRTPNAC